MAKKTRKKENTKTRTPTKPGAKRKHRPGAGRPRRLTPETVDLGAVERLARIGCPDYEIATVLDVSIECIKRTKKRWDEFSAALKKGRDHGKMSLRHAQYQTALKGNPALLIWLGKNMLGQRDTPIDANAPSVELTIPVGDGRVIRIGPDTPMEPDS